MQDNSSDSNISLFIGNLYHSKLSVRLLSLHHIHRLLEENQIKPGPVKRFIRTLVQSLVIRKYEESQWILAQMNIVASCLLSEEGRRNITEAIIELQPRIDDDKIRVDETCFLADMFILYHTNKTISNQDETKLLFIQSLYLPFAESLENQSSSKYIGKITSALNRLNTCDTNLYLDMMKVIMTSKTKVYSITLSMLIMPWISSNHTIVLDTMTIIVDEYMKKILQVKSPVPDFVLSQYHKILSHLTSSQWNEKISSSSSSSSSSSTDSLESASIKILKKAPETASHIIKSLISSVHVDLSQFILQGGNSCCLRLLKSSEVIVRNNGIDIVKQLFIKSSDSEALVCLLQTFIESLQGKSGPLTSIEHRVSIFTAITVCLEVNKISSILITNDFQSICTDINKLIFTFLEKENEESFRHLLSYGKGLIHSLQIDDRTSIEKLVSLGNNDMKLKLSFLEVIGHIVTINKKVNDSFHSMIPLLVNIIKEAMKKPQMSQPDAILAVYILMKLSILLPSPSSSSSSFSPSSEILKLVNGIFISSSFFFAPTLQQFIRQNLKPSFDVISQYGSSQYGCLLNQSMISIVHMAICSYHVQKNTHSLLVDILISNGLLNELQEIRKGTESMIISILSSEPSMFTFLLENIWNRLCDFSVVFNQYNEARIKNFKSSRSSDELETSFVSQSPQFYPSSRILEAVKRIVNVLYHPSSGFLCLKGENQTIYYNFVLIIQLISHPFVTNSTKHAIHGWNTIISPVLSIIQDQVEYSLDIDNTIEIEKISFQILSLFWNSTQTKNCGCKMIKLISIVSKPKYQINEWNGIHKILSILFNKVVSAIVDKLNNNSILKLSSFDLMLLSNFEKAIEMDQTTIQFVNNNKDKNTIETKSSKKGKDDEEWLERIKKEKESKNQQVKGSMISSSNDSKRNECLERKRIVESEVLMAQRCLDLMEYLSIELDSEKLFELLVLEYGINITLGKLLNSDLLSIQADRILHILVKKVFIHQESLSRDILDSIRVVSTLIESPFLLESGEIQSRKDLLHRVQPLQSLIRSLSSMIVRFHSLSSSSSSPSSLSSRPLSPSTIILLYPVLKGLLSLTYIVPGCEQSFAVLDAFVTKEFLQLRYGIMDSIIVSLIQISLHTLANFKVEPSPENLLRRITSSIHLSTDHWILILNENGIYSPYANVRLSSLRSIVDALSNVMIPSENINLFYSRLYLLQHDEEESICQLAINTVTNIADNQVDYFQLISLLLSHHYNHIREFASKSIASSFINKMSNGLYYLDKLKDIFISSLPPKKLEKISQIASAPRDASGKIDVSAYLSTTSIHSKSDISDDQRLNTRLSVVNTFAYVGKFKSLAIDGNITTSLQSELVIRIFDFLLSYGVVDMSVEVRKNSLHASRNMTDTYGSLLINELLCKFQEILSRKPGLNEDLDIFDHRHEAAVILLGAIGRYLPKEDPNVLSITDSLIEALKTPSETVQVAVADSLTQLVALLKGTEKAQTLVEQLIHQVLNGESYGERRGAAFGLSALIKGLGIPTLKNHDVINRLRDACSNGSSSSRQGSLFAFECLSDRLGLLFEPYVTTIIPVLLKSFSHSSDHVREASQMAAKIMMEKLSTHGVKQVLAPILSSLPTETQWKSRQEAIKLLGSMAFCNPKQLAVSLPQIIPRLVEAGSDPHPKVKETAKQALADITSVIKNPEILRLSPYLLAALSDPANKSKEALEALLNCEFMHSIDAPSLAILVPILGRALRDRGGDLKRKSSAITGNIITMISETKILVPYLSQLLPGLKDCLVDPIPDVRATSAKALGKIIDGMGEEETQPIVAWLLSTIRSESSPVERSGAAQGLAECCTSFDTSYTESIIRQVLEYRKSSMSAPREGLLWFFSFLPTSLQDNFAKYISLCLPVILSGLSDDDDNVREVALRAGQVIVTTLGNHHALDILPSLLDGIFDEDWRIRQSSVTLLGDLILLLSNSSNSDINYNHSNSNRNGDNNDNDDDDEENINFSSLGAVTSKTIKYLRSILGVDITNNMLASLYIIRSDTVISVRQVSLSVWKAMVSNTGKTLVEIMTYLVKQLIEKISSNSSDLRLVASRSLGEVVRKQGERILPTIIPNLKQGLNSTDKSFRQGICLGLTEILAAASRKQIEDFIDILIPALQQALSDPLPEVRQLGSNAFLTLFKSVGSSCVDDIIPPFLEKLNQISKTKELSLENERDMATAILGLKEVVACRPRDLLEYLIPKLTVYPMAYVNAIALEATVQVAGSALHYHFSELIPNIVHDLYGVEDSIRNLTEKAVLESTEEVVSISMIHDSIELEKKRFDAIKSCASSIMQAVTTVGVNHLISDLGKQIEHETNIRRRKWGCWLCEMFLKKSKADYLDYVPVILKFLLSRVADQDIPLLQAVNDTLLALTSSISLDHLMHHIDFIGNCIASTASDARHRAGGIQAILSSSSSTSSDQNGEYILPLLNISKALEPFLTIYLHGLMNGSTTIREQAADAICSIIGMCEAMMLKPFLIKVTGPLIRVVGERYPSTLKAAILNALISLLDKGGSNLKPFSPQLQTTFIKNLSDPSKITRTRAVLGLEKLMPLVSRIDPILTELCTNTLVAESNALKSSLLEAIGGVLLQGGDKGTSTVFEKVCDIMIDSILDEDENIRNSSSLCALGLGPFVEISKLHEMLLDLLEIPVGGESWTSFCGRIVGLSSLLISAGNTKSGDKKEDIFNMIVQGFSDERGNGNVKCTACKCVSLLLTMPKHIKAEEQKPEFRSIAQAVVHKFAKYLVIAAQDTSSSEIRKSAFHAIKQGAKYYPVVSTQHIHEYMPVIVSGLHDLNLSVKTMAERAMKYLLDGGNNQTVLNAYASKADSDLSLFVRDYARRIISKLQTDSDDEEKIGKW